MGSVKLQFRCDRAEDRLLLTVQGEHGARCWVTRKMGLGWVDAWLNQLALVPLPKMPEGLMQVETRMSPGDEHRLALEPDPVLTTPLPKPSQPRTEAAWRLDQVTLRVLPTGTLLQFAGKDAQVRLNLTRRDSHRVLRLLAQNVLKMEWMLCPTWPEWLLVPMPSTDEGEALR